jgi:hypothetical protein
VDIEKLSFRWGLEHAHPDEAAWIEIQKALTSISRKDVIDKQLSNFDDWRNSRKNPASGKLIKPPVGGQSVLNSVIQDKIDSISGWQSQIYVLNQSNNVNESERVPYWTMDFRKNKIGVEISFNNAGVFAQNMLRLSVMSESKYLQPEEMIKLGVLVVSTKELKKWGKMDSTVITFDQVETILPHITFSIPTPIVILGLTDATDGYRWKPTKLFGNKNIGEFEGARKSYWEDLLAEELNQNN